MNVYSLVFVKEHILKTGLKLYNSGVEGPFSVDGADPFAVLSSPDSEASGRNERPTPLCFDLTSQLTGRSLVLVMTDSGPKDGYAMTRTATLNPGHFSPFSWKSERSRRASRMNDLR